MQPMHVPAGARIFHVGDPSDCVYLIDDGEVAITVNDGVEVARLSAGALFGESGVLEKRCRAATATAIVATSLLAMDADTFCRAFGMDNDRALALVKLLCARLRSTTQRSAKVSPSALPDSDHAAIRLLPGDERLARAHGMTPIEIHHLPFQVGNRYGGETLPLASNHSCCIHARGDTDLGAPHFEIVRRDGQIGIHDLGTRTGTMVNGVLVSRASLVGFATLHAGDNEVIAGRYGSPFRFRVHLSTG